MSSVRSENQAQEAMSREEGGPAHTVQRALRQIAHDAGLPPVLTKRLLEIAEGLTYQEIARRHDISINTVKTESRILLESLGLHGRCEIEDAARAAGLRAESGADLRGVHAFLRLRFE